MGEAIDVLYEDNHIIIVNKKSGDIVQGDKTGDEPLSATVAAYLKEKYHKPGNVFVGVVHRLDRPVSGAVIFAKTSKALSRLNAMLTRGEIHKTYWALVKPTPREGEATLEHWLVRNEKQNKSYAYPVGAESLIVKEADKSKDVKGRKASKIPKDAKKALLHYKVLAEMDSYTLVEVQLMTGRHHQIRCQLAAIGSPIRGDLKYGARRSNPDGSISLHARRITFVHPVSKEQIDVEAPVPEEKIWQEAQVMA